jgi:iron-sulfur cluster repair protein YtfE (RIC family)
MASSNKLMKSLKENTDDRAVPQEAGAEHAACYQSIDDKVLEYLRKVSANLREDTP